VVLFKTDVSEQMCTRQHGYEKSSHCSALVPSYKVIILQSFQSTSTGRTIQNTNRPTHKDPSTIHHLIFAHFLAKTFVTDPVFTYVEGATLGKKYPT
jgi:hypothetical protein